ncbi:hypothetical protein TNCV_2031651 [Trichonephila clavipes]|nr:hypothetical protein TNCV_2031651 [Trichonephila clavipes]
MVCTRISQRIMLTWKCRAQVDVLSNQKLKGRERARRFKEARKIKRPVTYLQKGAKGNKQASVRLFWWTLQDPVERTYTTMIQCIQ